jgi:hypothetical protein
MKDNRCPECEKRGRLEFLSNKFDVNSDCWVETCSSEGTAHDCKYCLLHIERREKNIQPKVERRKNATGN